MKSANRLILILIAAASMIAATPALFGQTTYVLGNNTNLNLSFDFSQAIQVNPRTSGGENRYGFGFDFLVNHVKYDYKFIWETEANVNLNIQKQGASALEKNYDNLHLFTKYGFKSSYVNKYFWTGDATIRTSMLRTYDNKFIRNNDNLQLTSKFLSPLNSTLSLGLEYRPDDTQKYLYIAPLAVNVLYVADPVLAAAQAFNSDGEVLGSLHGNPHRINDNGKFSKAKVRFGLSAKLRYSYGSPRSKLNWSTNLDLFVAYQEFSSSNDFNPIQGIWESRLAWNIYKSLKMSLITEVLYDPDLVFLDRSSKNTYTGDKSFNLSQRFMIGLAYSIINDTDR